MSNPKQTTPEYYNAYTIYTSLTNLGLPRDLVSFEDFLRVYRHGGPLHDAISFLFEHAKGRGGVNNMRMDLLRVTESRDNSQTKLITRSERPERLPGDITLSRPAKAKKDMEMYSSILQDKTSATEGTQKQIATLVFQLSSQRRVDLLLEILEKKEKDRIRRFKEMGRLLVGLHRKYSLAQGDELQHIKPAATILLEESFVWEASPSKLNLNTKKPRHTQDTLMALQAYHVRLARLAVNPTQGHQALQIVPDTRSQLHLPIPPRAPPSMQIDAQRFSPGKLNDAAVIPAAESQLRSFVAQKLGIECNVANPEIERVFQGFIKVAKARARDQVRYVSSSNSAKMQDAQDLILGKDLDKLAAKVTKKAKALQDASDLSLKLAHSAEECLVSFQKFQSTTILSLRESLSSHSKSIRDYINHLRAHIGEEIGRDIQGGPRQESGPSETYLPGKSSARISSGFDREVRRILGLDEAVTSGKVLKETAGLIRHIRTKSQYLEETQRRPNTLPSSSQHARETEILASYESQKHQIEAATERLLTRKIGKADTLGSSLVQDIETLLKEVNDVVGHGKSK